MANPDVPEVALQETDTEGNVTLRAISDGQTAAIVPVSGGHYEEVMGDVYGGVLLVQTAGLSSSIQRIGFTPEVKPWRWVSPGLVSNVKQIFDGTTFAMERVVDGPTVLSAAVVIIDGATGAVRARVFVPTRHRSELSNQSCFGGYQVNESVGANGGVALSTSNTYGVVISDAEQMWAWTGTPTSGCLGSGFERIDSYLLVVDRDGNSAMTLVQESHVPYPQRAAQPYSVAADARGNFVVTLTHLEGPLLMVGPDPTGPALPVVGHAIVTRDGVQVQPAAGEGGMVATDVLTNQLLWTAETAPGTVPVVGLRGFGSAPETRRVVGLDGTKLMVIGPGATGEYVELGEPPLDIVYGGNDFYLVQAPTHYRKVRGPTVPVDGLEMGNWLSGSKGGRQKAGFPEGLGWHSNFNRIELETSKTTLEIFDDYISTFYGVNNADDQWATFSLEGGASRVTSVGQRVTFTITKLPFSLGQEPFSIKVVRFDRDNRVMAAHTEVHHPLRGWRYWRVYESAVSPSRVMIETGAYDRPGTDHAPMLLNVGPIVVPLPNPLDVRNVASYWGYDGPQLAIWKEYLLAIKRDLGNAPHTAASIIEGAWNIKGLLGNEVVMQKYIQSHFCGGAVPKTNGDCP